MSEDPSSATPLPLSIEEIDRAWLTRALRTRAPDAGLRDFAITRVENGTCTKIRIDLDLDQAGRDAGIAGKVILKGGFEPHSRAMPYMHASEVRSYREVLPELGLPHPACYFAEFDQERGQGIVIMEDLSARDVELCHPLRPHSPERVERRLVELARFHARTWGSAELLPGGKWSALGSVLEGGHLQNFLGPETWQRFLELPRGRAASVRFHDRHWMAAALEKLNRAALRLPNAVIHGDTHLGNLYVEADGTPGFFDSVPHRWSPLGEVAYHIGCALDQVDRRDHERALIGAYLGELARSGVAPPPLDEAMRTYAAFLSFGFCIFMVNAAKWQPEAINTAYTARFSAAMIDNDTLGALEELG